MCALPARADPARVLVRVQGIVQGVGFRPFVYRLATELGLAGWVRNDADGVRIDLEGPGYRLEELCRRLRQDAPPAARIEGLETERASVIGMAGFRIEPSGTPAEGIPGTSPIGPDLATCDECLAETLDVRGRRSAYPFTNCTQCGPRYTIAHGPPYDRQRTTMSGFTLCPDCLREYEDPADRRFHAEPNACPVCGPKLTLVDGHRKRLADGTEALDCAARLLGAGEILAIKGIGGYHIAVDARADAAVRELRDRKRRPDKPFAVMVADLAMARGLCCLDAEAEALLASPAAPIVVAQARPDASIAPSVAPGLHELGIFVPYAPLHHLLLRTGGVPLVMTSGNREADPIEYEDGVAGARLGPLADAVLEHDRPIVVRCDDSVVRRAGARSLTVRRSRGFTPSPIALPIPASKPILAVGGQLKNTVTVARGGWATPSHHVGDLASTEAFKAFRQAIDRLLAVTGTEIDVVAHDLHPEYLSTKLALDLDLPSVGVQHHHAHVAACLVEHTRVEPVVGVVFDGHGYGPDGTLWGGELIVADLAGFERVGHLRPVPVPGGETAIREPWRMALAWLQEALGREAAESWAATLDEDRRRLAASVLSIAGDTALQTTGAGRLFDAVAAIVGLRQVVTYEGQAAIELEAAAAMAPRAHPYACVVSVGEDGDLPVIDPGPALEVLLEDAAAGAEPAQLAAGFHRGLGEAVAELAADLAGGHGLDTVVLTGGAFQNALLHGVVAGGLVARGLRVLAHEQIPANDGGLSIGQAAVAAAQGAGSRGGCE